jgi:ribonuclease HI
MTALRLYTDGSCQSSGAIVGGWAWILVREHPVACDAGDTFERPNQHRCELTAAIKGLTYLLEQGIGEVELVSDSRHMVGGMSATGCTGCTGWAHAAAERGWRTTGGKPAANRELWGQLLDLDGRVSVSWRHVRGHRPKKDTSDDARYNREVDALAVKARQASSNSRAVRDKATQSQ